MYCNIGSHTLLFCLCFMQEVHKHVVQDHYCLADLDTDSYIPHPVNILIVYFLNPGHSY